MGRYALRQWIQHVIAPYRLSGNRVVSKKKARMEGREVGR